MRYCSYDVDKNRSNASENIVANTIALIFAPIRLFSEISKKIIFLGDYARKCLFCCIVGETIYLIVNGIYQISITKKIDILTGSIPLLSMFTAVIISIGLYFLYNKYSIDVDLDNLDVDDKEKAISQIEKEHSIESKTFIDKEGTIIDDITNYKGEYTEKVDKPLINVETTISEGVENGDIDIEDITNDEIYSSTDKSNIDPVYKNSDDAQYQDKLNELMRRFSGRNDQAKDETEKRYIVERINVKNFCGKVGLSSSDFDSKINLSDEEEDRFATDVQRHVLRGNVDDGVDIEGLIKNDFEEVSKK